MEIGLGDELTVRRAFAYPLQNALARREVLRGALLLLLPGVGWLLNMGHRIQMVHQMQHGREAWPAWHDYPRLLRSGAVTLLGMIYYYAPGLGFALLAWLRHLPMLWWPAVPLLVAATLAIPGYMTRYCYAFDAKEIFNPARALQRALEGGTGYWKAWGIAVSALVLSFGGLLLLGVGFLVTSVWFWQVAGFSFACTFSARVNRAA
ncbi:MAG TPA: hypothetical protein VMB50_22045 [Myxococcales bacterium]|nr:hypothetical protein [Myxococcales bacterium]